MTEPNRFYTIAKTPAEIILYDDVVHYIRKYDWDSARQKAKAQNVKVFFINGGGAVLIEEVPPEFLNLKDEIYFHGCEDTRYKYETSVNYQIAGQFFTSELAWRAHKRLFDWDMYVYHVNIINDKWYPAREVRQTREILEKFYPLKQYDTGPAGGIILRCDKDNTDAEGNYYYMEAAPVDIACASWQDAARICGEYSPCGINGWRLPSVEELKLFASVYRCRLLKRENVRQTTQTVFNWSNAYNRETATAVVTQENEDTYLPPHAYTLGGVSGGYYKSGNGPWRYDVKEFPVTDCLPVRPVRDFYAKPMFEEKEIQK